jgi:hypothetical protein
MKGKKYSSAPLAIIAAVITAVTIVAIVVCGGAFIGGFHAIKNYVISFKHNVHDSNRVCADT